MNTLKVNPELMSNQATHTYNGVKVKVFTLGMPQMFDFNTGVESFTAEIMEGEGKGKWATVTADKLIKL